MADTKQILKSVKKIEIKTRRLVDGLLQGAYHSIFKGRGIEFSEVREYQVGDDIRSIDWNVTARLHHPFVKEFIEERDLTILILFDVSASNNFGSQKEKKEYAAELAASLMFAALRNNDKIGLALFSNDIEIFIPASKGKRHVLKMIREMIAYQPKNKITDLNKSLVHLTKIHKKRGIIFVISDFITPDFSKPLRILRNKNDVIALNISDINEETLPDVGMIELEDEETGEQFLVNTSDRRFREEYSKALNKKNVDLVSKLRPLGVDMIQLSTSTGFETPLRKFFSIRRKVRLR